MTAQTKHDRDPARTLPLPRQHAKQLPMVQEGKPARTKNIKLLQLLTWKIQVHPDMAVH